MCLTGRLAPDLVDGGPGLAVGPWHVKMHVPACQHKYGARRMLGAGNSFGDTIEHLWAVLRKHAHILKRMALATREDHISDLVGPSSGSSCAFAKLCKSLSASHSCNLLIHGTTCYDCVHMRFYASNCLPLMAL